MRTISIAVIAFLALGTLPSAAQTVVLAGRHPLKKVETLCRFHGGIFSATAAGHGCSKRGYGKVWCSNEGKCVARLENGVKFARD